MEISSRSTSESMDVAWVRIECKPDGDHTALGTLAHSFGENRVVTTMDAVKDSDRHNGRAEVVILGRVKNLHLLPAQT